VAGAVGATLSAVPPVIASLGPIAPASVEVTVVDETCREPDDLLPLDEPTRSVELGECWDPLEADRGAPLLGGLPPADLGLPGGKLSATDIKAAIGLCPVPPEDCVCWVVPARVGSGGEPVRLFKGEPELEPLALPTEAEALGLNAVAVSKDAVLMGCFSCLKVLSVDTTNG
jgi:hypothetical protein